VRQTDVRGSGWSFAQDPIPRIARLLTTTGVDGFACAPHSLVTCFLGTLRQCYMYMCAYLCKDCGLHMCVYGKYSNVSQACIIIMHYAQIMRTGVLATQTPAAHHTTRRAHTRTPSLATEESHTHARAVLCRFFANSDYGGVQASCAFAPRRGSSLRSVASSTNHFAPQAARRSTCRHADTASTTASRRSRRERVAPLRHLRRERAC